jgi:HK97 family phage portal protein
MFALTKKAKTIDEIAQEIDQRNDAMGQPWAGGRAITVESALQQSTVFACVKIVAETIAALPIKAQTQQRDESGATYWVDSKHDALGVLYEPNPWQTPHDLVSMWVAWAELRGNGYSFKSADSKGRVRYLHPLKSTEVTVEQRPDWSLRYNVGSASVPGEYDPDRVFHYRNFGSDGYMGLSTVRLHANDIALSQRGKEHGARVLANGATAGRWIQADGVKNADAAADMQKQFDSKYAGAQNSGKTPVMWGAAKLEEIGMSAQDAQLLEMLQFQKSEIASIHGVPGFLLNATEKSTTWGSGLEEITKSFLRFSLRPRLSRLTGTFHRELLLSSEKQNTRFLFETDAFTMGSFKEIVDAVKQAVDSGLLNPNEGRDYLNKNPRDGGDIYRQTPNSVPEGSAEESTDEN